jgi:uncharacterized protein YndB with AHSA1/START domain
MTVSTNTSTSVSAEVTVGAVPERAFEMFTAGIDTWWIRDHHVHSGTLKEVGVDPFEGGRMWTENDAGEVLSWGKVLAWEPPHRFVFAWFIGGDWGPPRPGASSRVTVTFTPVDEGTRVVLVHDELDRLGPNWEVVRAGVSGVDGWPAALRSFAAQLAT